MAAPFASPTSELQAPRASETQGLWQGDRLEVRFSSEAALRRAVELVRGQSWVSECHVDAGARTVVLRMAAAAEHTRVVATASSESALLH